LSRNKFEKILLSAVEEGLSTLGDSSKNAIFFHLENSFKIKKEAIPSNIKEFKEALEGIFGPGATYLESMITKSLYDKLGLDSKHAQSMDFLRCVNDAKWRIVPKGECTIE
jgi:hypothetical protein